MDFTGPGPILIGMTPSNKARAAGAAIAISLAAGGFAAALISQPAISGAQEATATATAATSDPSTAAPAPDTASKPADRPAETALTGDTADKVSAAALQAVPGGTIIRVETDSDGSPYEAHVKKSDGTEVVVKVDGNFNVTSVDARPAGGPGGPGDHHGHDGPPPAQPTA